MTEYKDHARRVLNLVDVIPDGQKQSSFEESVTIEAMQKYARELLEISEDDEAAIRKKYHRLQVELCNWVTLWTQWEYFKDELCEVFGLISSAWEDDAKENSRVFNSGFEAGMLAAKWEAVESGDPRKKLLLKLLADMRSTGGKNRAENEARRVEPIRSRVLHVRGWSEFYDRSLPVLVEAGDFQKALREKGIEVDITTFAMVNKDVKSKPGRKPRKWSKVIFRDLETGEEWPQGLEALRKHPKLSTSKYVK
jgi:hypothetical protein